MKRSLSPGHEFLRRKFDPAAQEVFARLSGDANPVHLDAVAARRTLFGAPVVHGLHLALAAMEAALEEEGNLSGAVPVLLSASSVFLKPLLVGEAIHVGVTDRTADSLRIHGAVRGETIFRMTLGWSAPRAMASESPPPLPFEPLVDADFEMLAAAEGDLSLGLDSTEAERLFPNLMKSLGAIGMAELLALTRLVGMRAPGRHSLFGEFSVRFDRAAPPSPLHYRVQNADSRFHRLTMEVNASRLRGQVVAFVRPAPTLQAAMAEVAELVIKGSFAESVALIVGGTRGIGEIVAKLVSAGGGKSIITYFQGLEDAERVAGEIRAVGGRCEIARLNVLNGRAQVRRIFRRAEAPRTIYYCASPKIFFSRRGLFDADALARFNACYVGAFAMLLDAATAAGKDQLRVFYPSSVAVEESLREMAEYSLSKRLGEEFCSFYNRHSDRVQIMVERLPRIATDQTATLFPVPAEHAVEILAPIVRKIESGA